MPGKTGPHVIVRFLRFIEPEDFRRDGCWNWIGRVEDNGYPRFKPDGATEWAHRVAYELFIGPIHEGLDVCRSCDNRRCVRPDHLFAGTRLENMTDAMIKGRISRGQKHAEALLNGVRIPAAKLTTDSVRLIRQRLADGHRPSSIARDFGITAGAVNAIRRGTTWRHVR